jgi:hypothetical protein
VIDVHFGAATTGTGYWEDFTAGIPAAPGPRPLLVAYHAWGFTHQDIVLHTPLFELAKQQQWYIVAPLSASGVHVNSDEAQVNTGLVLEWMLANYDIDTSRIYGLGFSLGGGMACNFAARHLDPNRFMFAALVDHTGSVSQWDTYLNTPAAQYVFQFWYSPDPNNRNVEPDDFDMLRTSTIDFDPQTLVVDPQTDLARNLTHVPMEVSRAQTENHATEYLVTQCDLLVNHMIGLGSVPSYVVVPYSGHSWNSLDFAQAIKFLKKQRLRIPTNADTLADQDGTYFYFYVHQDAPGAFTPFSWSISETQNKVLVWKTRNLGQIDVDLPGTGLATSSNLLVVLHTDDMLADDVLLKGWPAAPSLVERDGAPQAGTYSYDPVQQELFIDEWDGTQTHKWEIYP